MFEIISVCTIFYIAVGLFFTMMYTDFDTSVERGVAITLIWPLLVLRLTVLTAIWLGKHAGVIGTHAWKELTR